MAQGGRIDYTVGFKVDKSGLAQIQTELSKLSQMTGEDFLKMNPNISSLKKAENQLNKLKGVVGEVQTAYKNSFNDTTGIHNIDKLSKSLNQIGWDKIATSFKSMGVEGVRAFNTISQQVLSANVRIKETNGLLDKMGTTLMNTIKWQFSSSLVNRFTGAVQQAVGYVQHLDSSLNDIRIVTGKSADEMEVFAQRANKAAQSLGKTTTDYTEAALIYYQQGLSDEEVAARAETTLKTANVTGQSTAAVSEELTAVWNGYRISTEETEAAIDKLAAVAATTASDLQELSTGMSKVASAANAMGVDMDQLNAQIATIISVTRQAPESVGTALKTIYARMGDLKLGETDEDGLGLGDVSGTLEKVGIAVLDANGDLREMGDVMEDVAAKWNTWTSAQQVAIAEVMAGKRQYNNLIALFDNWDMYSKALDTSKNSLGTLQQQQDIYMDSTEAHIQQLKAEWEDLYDSILDEDTIKDVSDSLRSVLDLLTKFIDSIGGGKGALLALGAVATKVFKNQIATEIGNIVTKSKNAKQNKEERQRILERQAEAQGFKKGTTAHNKNIETRDRVSRHYESGLVSDEELVAIEKEIKGISELYAKYDELNAEVEEHSRIVNKDAQDTEAYIRKLAEAQMNEAGDRGLQGSGGKPAQAINIKEGKNLDAGQKTLDFTRELLKENGKVEESVEKLKNAYTELGQATEEYNDLKNKNENPDYYLDDDEADRLEELHTKILPNLKKQAKETKEEVKEVFSQVGLDNEFDNAFKKVEASYKKLEEGTSKSTKGLATSFNNFENTVEELKQNVISDINEIEQKIQELPEEYDKLQKEDLQKEDALNQAKAAEEEFKEGTEQPLEDREAAAYWTNLASSIMSCTFAFQGLKELGSIWTDDDLDIGEKIGQTFTNLLIVIPSLITGLKGLAAAFTKDTLLKAKDKVVSIATTIANKGLAASFTMLKAAINPVGLAIAAVTGLFIAFSIASKKHQKQLEKNAEAAKKEADAAKEQLESTKERIEHLDELLEKYKELGQAIDNQTKTEQDAREEIYELCKAYDLQGLAVEALTGNYQDLENSIIAAQDAANENKLKDAERTKITSGEALKTSFAAKNSILERTSDKDLDQIISLAAFDPQKFYEKFSDKDSDVRKVIAENEEYLNEYRQAAEEVRDATIAIQAKDLGIRNVDSLKEFEEVKEKLLNNKEVQETFMINGILDEEALEKDINNYLQGIDSIKEYVQQSDIGETLIESTAFTQEDINEQLGKRSKAEIDFLVNNKELAEAEGDLDSFFKKYHDEIEYANASDNIINVEIAFTSALDNGKFDDDTIKKLYEDSDFEEFSKVSQEDFVKMSFQKQTELAQQYYHTLMDNEEKYQESVKQGLTIQEEEYRASIEEAAQAYTALQDRHQDVSVEQMSGDLAAQWSKSMQDVLQVSDEEFETFVNESLSKFAEGGIDALENMEPEIKNLFDKLIQAGYTEDQLKNQYKLISAYQDYEDVIDKLPAEYKKQGKEISKLCNDYEALSKRANLAGKALKGVDKSVAAMADFKKARSDIKSLNEEIDDLQSNYSSLQNIVEDYNADHMISIDNVQKLMEMDSKYVATLQFEGDQLSINDSMYEGLMQAEAQNMRLKAADLYLSELEAIATGQATEAGVQFELQTYANAQALGELVDMANAGTEALYRLSQVQAAMSKNKEATIQATQAFQNRLALIDNFANQSVTQGLGGGSGSGGGGGSEKDPEHEEYLEREADIYRTINEELEQIESTLGRIQNINDHEWGIDAQKTLEQENKLLDQQLEKLQEKKKLQERDLSTRRKQLEDVGVNFSADGSAMTNAESTLDAMYAHYNSMVDMYNAMSAAEQETYKANLEAEKDRIDKVEKKIDDYESTFSDYQSTLDSLIDVHYQQIENTVKQFNNMVDVHLELDEAKEEWNDFWFDVVQDIEDTDFTKQIEKSVKKLEVLIGTTLSNTDSEVSILTNHLLETVSEVQDQIASANRGGEASIFGDDSALSKETLENYRDQLMEALTSAKEELDNISDSYLDMLDSAQDKIDKQVKAWESIGEHLEHNVSLIKLISGDKSYEALDKIYQQQYQNNLQLLTTQRTSMEYWQNMIDKYANLLQTTEEGSKEWKTYSEAYEKASMNYKEAVSNLDKTIEDALNKLEEWKKSQLDAINETFDRTLSSNLGLDQLEKEWNVINDSASRYFDNVERALEMEGLEDAFDKVIENTKEASRAQQELNQMRDEEIARLNQKTKLSQFDIDEVKARLEIRKQELALEDAQKNKTNLRLRRDSQGNYNYQYTGDDSQIEEASEGLLSAKKEWYELVKNRNIDLAKAVLENRKNLQSELAALDDMYFENDDARRAKQIEIINKYAEREKDIMGDAENAKQIFFDGTAKFFADVENNTVLPQWNTTIEGMIDAWSGGGEDSFTNAVKRGIEEIEKVQDEFNIRTEEILTKAGVNYIKLKETGIDPTIDSLNELTESNEELESALEEVNDQLIEQESYLRNCEEAYNSLKDAAVNAIAQANSALNALAQTAIQTAQQIQAAIAAAQSAASLYASASAANRYGDNAGGGGGIPRNSNGTINNGGSRYHVSKGPNGKYSIYDTKYDKYVKYVNGTFQDLNAKGSFMYSGAAAAGLTLTDEEIRKILASYDTGGYTGSWGSNSGKIAMVHEKELILNKKDTENVLDAVNLLRTFSVSEIADSIIGAAKTSASILAGVTSKASQAVAGVSNNQTNNYRDMTINADFSGVKSADAIYQALTELSNYGMQEAYSNSPLANKSY